MTFAQVTISQLSLSQSFHYCMKKMRGKSDVYHLELQEEKWNVKETDRQIDDRKIDEWMIQIDIDRQVGSRQTDRYEWMDGEKESERDESVQQMLAFCFLYIVHKKEL